MTIFDEMTRLKYESMIGKHVYIALKESGHQRQHEITGVVTSTVVGMAGILSKVDMKTRRVYYDRVGHYESVRIDDIETMNVMRDNNDWIDGLR